MTTQALRSTDNQKKRNAAAAHYILRRLFRDCSESFYVQLWDESLLHVGKTNPAFTLTFHSPKVLRDLVLFHDPVRLAEAYFDGTMDVSGDFKAALRLRYEMENLKLSFKEKLTLIFCAFLLLRQQFKEFHVAKKIATKKRANDIESIAFHYDVSNAFYKLWLDTHMVYSCAYFEKPEQSLDIAQLNKLDYICRKLRLKEGEFLLDIGCGWGALVCWAAKYYGVRAHGITLSRNQYEYACQEVKNQGLEGKVIIDLKNYRDLPREATYDKVSSIGMFEHVGLKNLQEYFSIVHQTLKPGGLFLNHGITSDEADWKQSVSTKFINRHVFPDGELDTVSNIQRRMEEAKFEIFDLEGLRPHYAYTLQNWVQRLEQHRQEVIKIVGERTYRIWRLYMTGCALQFEYGATGIYQILAERKHDGMPFLPLTRRDLYRLNKQKKVSNGAQS